MLLFFYFIFSPPRFKVRWEASKFKDVLIDKHIIDEGPQETFNMDYAGIFELANDRRMRHDVILAGLPTEWKKSVLEIFKLLREVKQYINYIIIFLNLQLRKLL